jgi:hypothetical protein
MGSLTSTLVISLKDDVSGPAKKVGAALKNAGKQVEAIGKAGISDRLGSQLAQLGLRAKDIDKVSAAWKQYSTAQGLAGKSSDWTKSQVAQVRTWESATVAALRNVTRERQRFAVQQAKAAAGSPTGYKAKDLAKKAVISAAEFDIGVRKQREFVDVAKGIQDRILIPQAKKIGQDTQFSNLDVVKAQTKAMQGLPSGFSGDLRAEVGAAIVESVKNYALTMEADLEGSSEAIRTFLQTTNKDISTKAKAVAEATRATNLMVKMAKLGGMNDEDVQQFMKFGAGTATAAGLSDTTLAALGATGRRGGLRGDELGVFVRAVSSKLVAPTGKGLDALTAAGIDYNKFTKMPGGLSVGNLDALTKRRFGKGLNEGQIERLDSILDDSEVVSSKEEFTKQVSAVIEESFAKTKGGKTKAQDAQKIAKMVGDFHKLSTDSVDAEGLLNAIMTNPKMSIALLNAMFTDKHGGKGSILASKWGEFKESKTALDKVGEDPDFAKHKADEIMGGLGGSFERLKGSVENLTLSIGQAHEAWLKPAMDKTGNAMDAVSNLKPGELAAASTVAAGGGAMAALALVRKIPWVQSVIGAGSGTATALGGIALAGYAAYSLAEGANERQGITRDSTRERQRRQAGKYNKWGMYTGGSSGGDSVFDKGTDDWTKTSPSSQGSSGSSDVWSKGTEGIDHLNQPGAAAAAAKTTVNAYMAAAAAALAAVDPIFAAAVARWNGILGGVNSTPSITPKFGPAPSVGKGAGLDAAASKHASFSDGNHANGFG